MDTETSKDKILVEQIKKDFTKDVLDFYSFYYIYKEKVINEDITEGELDKLINYILNNKALDAGVFQEVVENSVEASKSKILQINEEEGWVVTDETPAYNYSSIFLLVARIRLRAEKGGTMNIDFKLDKIRKIFKEWEGYVNFLQEE